MGGFSVGDPFGSPPSLRCAARQNTQQRMPTMVTGTTAEARRIRFRTVTPELPSSVPTDGD